MREKALSSDIFRPQPPVASITSSEANFRAVFQDAAIGIAVVDMEGHPVRANPALERILGYSADELSRMIFTDFTHPEDTSANWTLFEELVAGDRDHYQLEKRYFRKDGELIWGQLTVSLIRDQSGDPAYAIGMVTDVTDRKRAEEAIHRSEAKYRRLLERVPAVVYEVLGDGVNTANYMSPYYEILLGYTPEERLADPELWTRMIHPEDRQRILAASNRSRETSEPFEQEYRLVAKDGRVVWVRDNAVIVTAGAGKPMWQQGVMLDVTALKGKEHELAEAETRYRTLVEQISAITYTWVRRDDQYFVEYSSPQIEPILGYTPEEWIAEPTAWFGWVHEEDRSAVMEENERREVTAEAYSMQYRMHRKDGRTIWVEDSWVVVRDERDAHTVVQGVVFDITARKQSEEAARQSEARKAEMLDAALDCIISIDGAGRIVEFNPAAEATFGYPRGEVIGEELAELLIPPAFRKAHRDGLSDLGTIGEGSILGKRLELSAVRRGGEEFPIELTVTRTGTKGRPLYTGFVRDITERKRADREIQRSIERLEGLHEIDRAILISPSIEDQAPPALKRLRRLTDADRAAMLALDVDRGLATYVAVDPEQGTGPGAGVAVPLGDLLPLDVLMKTELTMIEDLAAFGDSPAAQRMVAQGMRSCLIAMLVSDGEPIGMLAITASEVGGIDPSSREVVREVADQLAVALQHARLKEDLARHTRELEGAVSQLRRVDNERRLLLSRLVTAQEEERKRIASDIHDDSIQKVAAASLRLDMLRANHPELDDDEGFAKAQASIRRSIESMRHLMFELRPYVLDRDGLIPALRLYLDEESKLEGGPEYLLQDHLSTEPPHELRIVLYRIVQEALVNARKHAHASRVEVYLGERDAGYLARVTDDGVGFDAGKRARSPKGHLGVTAMRERAELAAGRFTLDSSPGAGTVVEFWLPGHAHVQRQADEGHSAA
jgi:PAS domain S-box-containing protein